MDLFFRNKGEGFLSFHSSFVWLYSYLTKTCIMETDLRWITICYFFFIQNNKKSINMYLELSSVGLNVKKKLKVTFMPSNHIFEYHLFIWWYVFRASNSWCWGGIFSIWIFFGIFKTNLMIIYISTSKILEPCI